MTQRTGFQRGCFVLCLLAVSFLTAETARGDLILDQVWDETYMTTARGAYNTNSTTYRIEAQSFTPTLDNIARVELYISSSLDADRDVTLGIYETTDSGPTYYPSGSPLTSVTVNSNTLPASREWYAFDLPQASLNIGQVYVIVLSVDEISGGNVSVAIQSKPSGYAGGRHVENANGTWSTTYCDAMFKTYGVPEPATMSLLGAGLVVTCLRRRRK